MERNLEFFPVLKSGFIAVGWLIACMCACGLGIGAIGGIMVLGLIEKQPGCTLALAPIIALVIGFFCNLFIMRDMVKRIVEESSPEKEG